MRKPVRMARQEPAISTTKPPNRNQNLTNRICFSDPIGAWEFWHAYWFPQPQGLICTNFGTDMHKLRTGADRSQRPRKVSWVASCHRCSHTDGPTPAAVDGLSAGLPNPKVQDAIQNDCVVNLSGPLSLRDFWVDMHRVAVCYTDGPTQDAPTRSHNANAGAKKPCARCLLKRMCDDNPSGPHLQLEPTG